MAKTQAEEAMERMVPELYQMASSARFVLAHYKTLPEHWVQQCIDDLDVVLAAIGGIVRMEARDG